MFFSPKLHVRLKGGEGMNVKDVYLTAEVADKLKVNQAYLLRTAKDLKLYFQ